MEFRVDWFAVTIWETADYGLKMWDLWFHQYLGELQDQGYGGRVYGKIYKALAEAKVYCTPKLNNTEDKNVGHFHYELPGSACAALPAKLLQEFIITLISFDKFQVTRLDLAWDGVPFTPKDLDQADKQDLFRTYARRSTFRFEHSRHDEREDGTVGHSIFRMGSRQSSRHMRVYDYHGPVRLELECRSKRADLIARDVLIYFPDDWSDRAIPHLRDFLDIDADYWQEFVQLHARASRTIKDARTEEVGRIALWVYKQVAPSLSVLADLYGETVINDILDKGRKNRGGRYSSILNNIPSGRKEGQNE